MARVVSATLVAAAMVSGSCGGASSPPVTFNKDVAPIVFANCVTCHRPGGDGPFSLLTYADAAGRAEDIAEQTLARHMPPWLPEPGDVPIVGVRRLSQIQIDTIQGPDDLSAHLIVLRQTFDADEGFGHAKRRGAGWLAHPRRMLRLPNQPVPSESAA